MPDRPPALHPAQAHAFRLIFDYPGGIRDVVREAQRRIGTTPDGQPGPRTRAAFNYAVPHEAAAHRYPAPAPPRTPPRNEPPWLAIGRSVIGLHEGRNNAELARFLASDGRTLGNPKTLPWCFTGETEILTESGWQRFDALTASRVYQVDEDGALSLTGYVPVEKEYDGDVFDIKHRSFNLTCDVGHKWWGQWGRTRDRMGEASSFGTLDTMNANGLRIKHPHAEGPGCGLSPDELAFLAAYISDGFIHRGRITIQVSKDRKLEALREMSPVHTYEAKKAYGRSKKPLTDFFFEVPGYFDDVFAEGKTLRDGFVHSMNREDARAFLRAFTVFDGNGDFDKTHLYTSSPELLNHLTVMCVFAGWGYSIAEKESPLSDKPSWEIRIGPNKTARRILKRHVSRRAFLGKLYCVTVPQSRIVVRDANGAAVVTGNCGDLVETCIRLALPAEPIPNAPYRARNWAAFGVECPPTLGAVAVFWRGSRTGTAGHVGFVVGSAPGKLYILGGNQSDAVTIAPLSTDRLLATRWPSTVRPGPVYLPALTGGTVSRNEA